MHSFKDLVKASRVLQVVAVIAVAACTRPIVNNSTLDRGDERGLTADLRHGCAPKTCVEQARVCGTMSDGYGGTITCGTCSAGNRCSKNGTKCVWHDARFATAGHAECMPVRWSYEWDNNYVTDQSAPAPDHTTPFVVGKLDYRKLSIEPQLVTNPYFDRGLSGWLEQSSGAGSWTTVTDAARNDRVAAIMHKSGPFGTQLAQILSAQAASGQHICGTTLAKGAGTNINMQLILQSSQPPYEEYAALKIPATGRWMRASICAKVPAGKVIQITLRNYTPNSTVYFDNVGTNPQYTDWEKFPAVCAGGVQDSCIDAIYDFEHHYIWQRLSRPENQRAYWIVGNEPDSSPAVSGKRHAQQFLKYRTLIKSLDPEARIANGGFADPDKVLDSGWLDEFVKTLGGPTNQPDVWNVHLYPSKLLDNGAFNLRALSRFRKYLAGIDQSDKPVWVTEFGVLDKTATQAHVDNFLRNIVIHLSAEGLAQRWFWFLPHCLGWCADRFTPFTGLCDGTTPTATGNLYLRRVATTNLVQNASFEEGATGIPAEWEFFTSGQGTVTKDSSHGFDDWSAARIEHMRGPGGTQIMQEVGPVTPGQVYAVNGWLRSADSANAAIAFQVLHAGILKDLQQRVQTVGNRWTRLKFEVIVPAGVTSARVVCRNQSPGATLWCDAITVTRLPIP